MLDACIFFAEYHCAVEKDILIKCSINIPRLVLLVKKFTLALTSSQYPILKKMQKLAFKKWLLEKGRFPSLKGQVVSSYG